MEHCTQVPYFDGMKYVIQTDRELQFKLNFVIENECMSDDGELEIINTTNEDGSTSSWLCICDGYAWDGASGPTYDSLNSMRGGLVHDGLYQLMREGKISRKYRKDADEELYIICREDGMNYFRAQSWYWAVRGFAGFASKKKNRKKVKVAP